MTADKVYKLRDAVRQFINDGDEICFGGFTTTRKPYALVYEILRQGIKDLIIDGGPAGGEVDLLIGAGRVKVLNNTYCANSGITNVGRRFRAAIENNELLVEDYSLDAQLLMFHAGALGLPFVSTQYMLGSSLETEWGISKDARKSLGKIPREKLIVAENPFNLEEKTVLLASLHPDVAVIHAQKASPDGTVRIEGSLFADLDMAMSARRCIVSCEELVTDEEIRKDPSANTLPGFTVDAVVLAPHGSHPSQCYNYYDQDVEFFKEYDVASRTVDGFNGFLNKWVYGMESHEEYMEALGAVRLKNLRVTAGLGFVSKRK